MTTLKERLIEVMEDLGISGQRELADFCDVSEGLVLVFFCAYIYFVFLLCIH
jgi:hypothetical protein